MHSYNVNGSHGVLGLQKSASFCFEATFTVYLRDALSSKRVHSCGLFHMNSLNSLCVFNSSKEECRFADWSSPRTGEGEAVAESA